MERGKLIIVSGFSGVGKGTVVKKLLEDYNDCAVSISATTRSPRENEIDGVHYFYKTREEFEEMISNDQLLEYAEYVGNYYGTPSQFVNEQRDKGIHVILEIEMQGALKVKEKARDSKLVFILPPSAKELKSRLVGRGTETEAVIAQRLQRAAEETSYIDSYEYYVVNDDLQECVEDIRSILDDKFDNKLEEGFIANIKKEISVFSKGEF